MNYTFLPLKIKFETKYYFIGRNASVSEWQKRRITVRSVEMMDRRILVPKSGPPLCHSVSGALVYPCSKIFVDHDLLECETERAN